MTEQLGLDVAPERCFTCCGAPCGPVDLPRSQRWRFPHTEDCPNPNIGVLFDRWGRQIFHLCCTREKPCPPGGCQPMRDKRLPVLASFYER